MKSKAGKKENLAISPSAKKLKSPVVAQVVKAKPDKSSKALKASKAEKANRSVAIVPSPKAGKVGKGLETKASAKQAKAPKVREMAPAIKELAAEKPVKSAKKPKVEEKLRKDVSKLEKVSAQPEISATTDDSTSPLDKTKVSLFVDALFKLHEKQSKDSKEKLFDDDDTERISLMIGSIKLPSEKRQHVLKINLPHGLLPEPTDVCLIVKDLQKGLTVDHEPSANHFKELLADKGVGPDLVSTVLPLRELKVEYKQFETKTALCHRFDAFLADDRIIKFVPQFLGKAFYKRKKFPIPVNLKALDLKAEIVRALTTTTLPLNHRGSSSMVQIGHVGMSKVQITENLMRVIQILDQRFPGGFKNVRSLHLKTEKSMAIPVHISSTPVNEIGFVDATLPKRKVKEEVTDEVSTQPGLEVTIRPDGKLKIRKKPDPNWDNNRDENLSDESDDDVDEASSDAEDAKKSKAEDGDSKKEKKGKKEAKKRSNADSTSAEVNAKKKKKAGKEAKVENESDDEEIDAAEQKYLKKQLEAEAPESKKKKKKEEEVAKVSKVVESDSDEPDEVEEFESSEEEEEVFDDELGSDAEVIEDSDGEDDDSEAGDDENDEKLVLKNQPQPQFDDSDDEKKPKRLKKSKKERRMDAKKQKAEGGGGGSGKKPKKGGKKK